MKFWLQVLIQSVIFIISFSTCFANEGIIFNRFRFSPELSISEIYSDNVFLVDKDEASDSITTVSPKLSVDFAISPEHFITLSYGGDFRYYGRFDNFRQDIHHTNLSWTWNTSKGSKIRLGGKTDYDSIQPFSEADIQKDFVTTDVFADTLFKIWSYTDMAIKYDHIFRRFKDSGFEEDEFDSDSITVDIMYEYSPASALIVSYTYNHQDNNDISGTSNGMDTHIILAGAQWKPTSRLSGRIQAGYYQTSLENEIDSNGFAMDTDLTYRLSDFIQLKAAAFRKAVRSTAAARETGDFYISTGGSFLASYRRWEPLIMSVSLAFMNNKFEQQAGQINVNRKDDLYSISTNAEYFFTDRLSSIVSYHYRNNDSNFINESYKENRVEAKLAFAF